MSKYSDAKNLLKAYEQGRLSGTDFLKQAKAQGIWENYDTTLFKGVDLKRKAFGESTYENRAEEPKQPVVSASDQRILDAQSMSYDKWNKKYGHSENIYNMDKSIPAPNVKPKEPKGDSRVDASKMPYTTWKKKYKDGDFQEWKDLRAMPEEQISEMIDMDNATSTPSERNKTGLPYTTWAKQQKAIGQPASYDDWLEAKTGGTIGGEAPTGDTTTGDTTGDTTGTQTDTTTGQNDGIANAIKRADEALKNGLIDQKTYDMFTTIARNYDISKEINYDNIIAEFEDFSKNTISPYYAEQADIFKKDLQTAVGNLEQSRTEELEAQGIQSEQRIEGSQEDLARRGMTFSSEAGEQLGAKSAFGDKVPFGGQLEEGLVPTQNRLIASGSERGYQQAIDALGRQAEGALGQNNLVQGFTPRGVTQGTIGQAEESAKYSKLLELETKGQMVEQTQKPLKFNFT